MIVPVLWVSHHPDSILARGYHDQGLLEAMLAREVWTPPDAVEFEHFEVHEFTDIPREVAGALVVIPARHHASDLDLQFVCRLVEGLEWSVVVLSGDEEWAFPWREIEETDTRRTWVMQPVKEQAHLSGHLPGGWYPGTHDEIAKHRDQADSRPLDWFFAGQVTHERREDLVRALKQIRRERTHVSHDSWGGHLHETDGYLQGMPQADYFRLIAGAKVVPCPSGPMHVDTARTFEALEAGCVPVVDTKTPNESMEWYFSELLGLDLPSVAEWSELSETMRPILRNWTDISNRCFAQWQRWKRNTTLKLDAQLREVSGQPSISTDPNDLITVLLTTSPCAIHPSTEHLEQTLASVRAQLPNAEIIIVADGVRPEQEDRTNDYQEYLRRVLWLANNEWHNVLSLLTEGWGHQANAVRHALNEVRSPLVLFAEHDTPIEGEFDWGGLCRVVSSGAAEAIRFHIYDDIHPEHQYLMLDSQTRWVADVPLRRTVQWWQRPHLASTAFYRDKVMPLFTQESRTMIEDLLYGVVESAFFDYGEAGWESWRLWVYCPEGGFKRSGHLDGRGDAPKFEMKYE